MPPDLLSDLGPLFLGSRLKRLAERLQTDAGRVHRAMGLDAQPAELALLAALDRFGPLTVSGAVESLGVSQPAVSRTATALVERGLIASESDEADLRQKTMKLTRSGRALVARAKGAAWPAIAGAVSAMLAPLEGTLLEQIAGLERQLTAQPLDVRARELTRPDAPLGRVNEDELAAHAGDPLAIREYADDLAASFYDINAEWIEAMFTLEAKDREILSDPRRTICDPGGFVLFVESAALGVVGTCALMKVEDGIYELTKMGVRENARGRKAGELLLQSVLARASAMKIHTLYLLTNAKCVAAIRLYEKLGFEHDDEIMRRYGSAYARCDVAMRYRGSSR